MDNQTLLYSRVEAARQLQISPKFLDTLIARRRLRPCRLGKRVLVSRSELEAFIQRAQKEEDDAAGHPEKSQFRLEAHI